MFRLRNIETGLEHAFEEKWQALKFWAETEYSKLWESNVPLEQPKTEAADPAEMALEPAPAGGTEPAPVDGGA